VQNQRSADAETHYGGEGDYFQPAARHPEEVGNQRQHGTENAQDIEPERRANLREILSEP
jgi:hypothetical protein